MRDSKNGFKARRGYDWANKEAERIILIFWKDIEGHYFGRKTPIAKLEMNIAKALRKERQP